MVRRVIVDIGVGQATLVLGATKHEGTCEQTSFRSIIPAQGPGVPEPTTLRPVLHSPTSFPGTGIQILRAIPGNCKDRSCGIPTTASGELPGSPSIPCVAAQGGASSPKAGGERTSFY